MTKTSLYCYEKNGGACKNKVSLTNNFICGAGHGKETKSTTFAPRELALGLSSERPAIDCSKMRPKQRETLASSTSTPSETLALLAEDEDKNVRQAVASNTSASLEVFVQLAEQGYIPFGFTMGKPIDELIKDISLVDQYPDAFGVAYFYRLLHWRTAKDALHPKRRALIGYVYSKCSVNEKKSNGQGGDFKDKVKAIFPNDQELAEMVGY